MKRLEVVEVYHVLDNGFAFVQNFDDCCRRQRRVRQRCNFRDRDCRQVALELESHILQSICDHFAHACTPPFSRMSMALMAAKCSTHKMDAAAAWLTKVSLIIQRMTQTRAAAARQQSTVSDESNESSTLTAAVVIAMRGELGLLTEIDFILGVAKGGIQKRPPVPLLHPSKLVAGAPTGTEGWPYIWPILGQ